MEVETQKPPLSETWSRWEGQSVNGAFPLRRCLGSSDHSGVFLTEDVGRNLPKVALKLVPAIPTLAESQLSQWGEAASLEHPNLIRIYETGRCQLGGSHYLYVVMDYAEQNLAQLLLHRALSEAEVREMLPLTLDALAFLHTRNLVQGQLKPSNVLVVENRLALASDAIRPADEATASIGMLSIHNPPEARDGSFSTAGDVWALGVTLCQALTQRTPLQSSERRDLVVLPPDIPPAFNDLLRRCLARNPAQRPSIGDLQEWLKTGTLAPARPVDATVVPPAASTATTEGPGAPPAGPGSESTGRAQAPPGSAAAATGKVERQDAPTRLVIRAVIDSEPPAPEPAERRYFVPVLLGAVVLVAVGWAVVAFFRGASHTNTAAQNPVPAVVSQAQNAPVETPQATPPAAAPAKVPVPVDTTRPGAASVSSTGDSLAGRSVSRIGDSLADRSVTHEDIPSVPARARATIHGHIKITVRVTIDDTGAVVGDSLVRPGPSKYFARLASRSARRWHFDPAGGSGARQALIRFDFVRSGTSAHVVTPD